MSALPPKQTLVALQSFGLKRRTSDVRFTPESGHSHGSRKRSAYDPKRTFTAPGVLSGRPRSSRMLASDTDSHGWGLAGRLRFKGAGPTTPAPSAAQAWSSGGGCFVRPIASPGSGFVLRSRFRGLCHEREKGSAVRRGIAGGAPAKIDGPRWQGKEG